MLDIRTIRVGLPPLLVFSLALSRSDTGAHVTLSIFTFKLGFHFGLSMGD
jgi:hypothetical protein